MGIAYDGGLTCSCGSTDLDRTITWYERVLGFELLYRRDDIAWCELRSPVADVNVGFGLKEEGVPAGGGAVLTFGVVDIAAAKAELERHGVRQDGEVMEVPGMVKLLTFYDPDDNALMFYQDLSAGHA